MYLRRFYFIILVYANLKMEYDTKDKTFWKRKGNDMKVLLGAVNAKYIHSNLAVYCLKAYAEKYGDTSDEISIGEYTINQQLDEILRDIYKRKPDMLCLSCYIWNLTYVEEICREIKKVMPQNHFHLQLLQYDLHHLLYCWLYLLYFRLWILLHYILLLDNM